MPKKEQFISAPKAAKILGISRVAVFKRIKAGQLPAIKIGRNYAINRSDVGDAGVQELTAASKQRIDQAVKKTVAEYGEMLKLLARE